MAYTKYLKGALVGGLFLSLALPFIVSYDMFFPFITGKNFAFRVLVELMFVAYALLALRDPQYRPRFSWILVAVGLFTLWMGIATLFSVDPVKSFWSNFERMEGYLTVLHLFVYFLVATAVLTTERWWTLYLRGMVASGALMAVYGMLQLVGILSISSQSGARLDSTFGNATYLAVFMLMNIFLSLVLLKRDWKNVALRWAYGVVAVLCAIVLFYTESRGPVLGLLGGLIVSGGYLLWAGRREPEWRAVRKIAFGGLAAVVILIGGFFAVKNTEWVKGTPTLNRLASISLEDKTTKARFIVWDMAWQGFVEKPVFGWGQENFNFVFNKYYDPRMYDQEQWFDRAHNAFIDWAMNGGAPGFLLFLSFFLLSAWVFARTDALSVPERAALLGLLAAYAFHELFVFDNLISYLYLFIILAFAHTLSKQPLSGALFLSRPMSERGIAVAAPVVIIMALSGLWFFNVEGAANAREVIKALQPGEGADGLSESLKHFDTMFKRNPLGRQEGTEQLLQMAIRVARIQGASPQIKQSYYNASVDAITEMTTIREGDARLELFFGAFLNQFGNYAEAEKHIQKASELSQNKQSIIYELGVNTYLAQGKVGEAIQVLQKAYELDERNDAALGYYAAALHNGGQGALADKLLLERFGTLTPDNDVLTQVYLNTKQYTRLESIFRSRLAGNSGDLDTWVNLAQILYLKGNKAGAIQALRDAAAANPSFEAQAKELIGDLESER